LCLMPCCNFWYSVNVSDLGLKFFKFAKISSFEINYMNTEFELSIVRMTGLLSCRNRMVLARFVLLLPIVVQFSWCAVFLTIYCTLIHLFRLRFYSLSQRQFGEHDNWGYDGVKSKFLTELRAPDFIFCIPGALKLAQFMNLDFTFLISVCTVS
jgi:hypothetical protein